ncbi:MAG: putative porin, partial [Burkholderiales bacterium]
MTKKEQGLVVAPLLALALALGAPYVAASEREDLEQLRNTTLALIQALVDQGLLGRDKAAELIRNAQARARAPTEPQTTRVGPDGKPVVRVPYVTETVKTQIREEVKQEVLAQAKRERWGDVGALPDWLERFRFEGDLRLRMQNEMFDRTNTSAAFYQAQGAAGNPAYAPDLINTTEDRGRFTLRARFGFLAQVGQNVQAGFRVSTGSLTSPASTSQTLGGGNNNFNRYTIGLDRAYVRWRPETWLELNGGRMPNPFFSTDLVWAEDLAFDGVAATVRKRFSDNFLAVATVGMFPLQELEASRRDRWLTGVQAGAEWTLNEETRLKFGIAQYMFRSIEGVPQAAGSLGTTLYGISEYRRNVRQKGNTLVNIADPLAAAPNNVLWGLASRFQPLNLTATAEFAQFDPVFVTVTADYVKNLGFDRAEIR